MSRHPAAAVAIVMASAFALLGALALVVAQQWTWAVLAIITAVGSFVWGVTALRRAPSEKMESLRSKNERWVDAWARGMARSAGSWAPRSGRAQPTADPKDGPPSSRDKDAG